MNQKFSITMFAAGLPTFLGVATEIISNGHNQWSYFYATPLGALHFFILGVSFVTMIAGALGTQIPRDAASYTDRKTDRADVTTDSPGVGNVTVTVTKEPPASKP